MQVLLKSGDHGKQPRIPRSSLTCSSTCRSSAAPRVGWCSAMHAPVPTMSDSAPATTCWPAPGRPATRMTDTVLSGAALRAMVAVVTAREGPSAPSPAGWCAGLRRRMPSTSGSGGYAAASCTVHNAPVLGNGEARLSASRCYWRAHTCPAAEPVQLWAAFLHNGRNNGIHQNINSHNRHSRMCNTGSWMKRCTTAGVALVTCMWRH
jgi:hypothetical protein